MILRAISGSPFERFLSRLFIHSRPRSVLMVFFILLRYAIHSSMSKSNSSLSFSLLSLFIEIVSFSLEIISSFFSFMSFSFFSKNGKSPVSDSWFALGLPLGIFSPSQLSMSHNVVSFVSLPLVCPCAVICPFSCFWFALGLPLVCPWFALGLPLVIFKA